MGEGLTIDQLAQRTGLTVRNVRAYQARGIIPPPRLVGRTGYYGDEHLERLEIVRRLQAEGLTLATITKALQQGGLSQVVLAPFAEQPQELSRGELEARLGGVDLAAVEARAIELGLVEVLDGERVKVLLPSVVRRAEELLAMGVPLTAQLDTVEVVSAATHQMADAFIDVLGVHLVASLAQGYDGDPTTLQPTVDRLSQLAADVVAAFLGQAITERITRLLE